MKSAIELLKEVYGATCRGDGYGTGLVYATKKPITEIDQETLDVIVWE